MGGSNSSQRRQRNANEENMYPGMANLRQQQAAAAQEQFQLAQNEVQATNAATRQEQQESHSQRRQSPRRGNHGRIIVNGPNQFMMMSPQLVAPPRHVDSSEADAIKSFAASKASSFSIEVDPVVGDSIRTLTFVMDSTVSSIVHVYIGVRVQLVRDGISLVPVDLLGTPTVEPKNVSSGLNQKVSFELVFMNELPSSILNYDAATAPTHVPLVVSIKYQTSEGIPQCHYALLAFPQGGSRMTVIRELLEVKKIVYQLEHIYGGDVVGGSSSPTNQNKNDSPNGDSGTSAAEDDDENYCVICLSEPLDTTVLPCRHFCMCSSCAEIVKNRNPQQCPVCRGKIDQLLRRK